MQLQIASQFRYCFISTWLILIILYSVDSITPDDDQRVRWIALGDRIRDVGGQTGVEIDTWNLVYPVSTMVEVGYGAKKGMRINWIVATASKMNGFVSIVDGGLDEKYVKIRYMTENGAPDELYVFVESYKTDHLILDDNVARNGNVAVVYNGIRNWTAEI